MKRHITNYSTGKITRWRSQFPVSKALAGFRELMPLASGFIPVAITYHLATAAITLAGK